MAKSVNLDLQNTHDNDKKFPLSKLGENCQKLFNVSISTFNGATINLNKEIDYSVEEIKNTIQLWKKTEVK